MLLCGTARILNIITRKSQLNFQLLNLQRKLQDLQSYAASIGDNIVSIDDLLNAPASMFERMSIFAMTSHQTAMQYAQQNIGLVSSMNQANMTQLQPQFQQQYQQMMIKNLYDQAREKITQSETKRLNVEETKINQQVSQIQTQLQMLDKEQEATQKQVDKDAENCAPKYA